MPFFLFLHYSLPSIATSLKRYLHRSFLINSSPSSLYKDNEDSFSSGESVCWGVLNTCIIFALKNFQHAYPPLCKCPEKNRIMQQEMAVLF